MNYGAPIEEAGHSSKQKAIKQSRDRNIHSIVSKLGINVGLIKTQVLSEN